MTAKSIRTVRVALIGNALVATTKFVAAVLSGSASMLTEAVHSTTDTANQIVLLIGNRRSARRSDASHNFGYGMEIYYWTFVVAIMILFSGGIFSVYTGWRRVLHPQPVESVPLSLAVLGLSALFEGGAFAVGYRQFRALVAEYDVPKSAANLWTFIKVSKDPNLYETLLEDGAALIGLAMAAVGVILTSAAHIQWADGAASVAIGLLLIANSFIVLQATRSLMGGEVVSPMTRKRIDKVIAEGCSNVEVVELKTLHLGPERILVSVGIRNAPDLKARQIRADLQSLRNNLKRVDDRIRHVMVDII
jgi:cation diffusion facilitator family transporter